MADMENDLVFIVVLLGNPSSPTNQVVLLPLRPSITNRKKADNVQDIDCVIGTAFPVVLRLLINLRWWVRKLGESALSGHGAAHYHTC
jgi:hypothetical protein